MNTQTPSLLTTLNIQYPIIQAPMAGISTVELAAAVSNAGGLGSLGLGNASVDKARTQIRAMKAATSHAFNVNFFCHKPARSDPFKEQQWLNDLAPYFHEFSALPPKQLTEDYCSFQGHQAMLNMVLEERPPIVSFHFGMPDAETITALKSADIRVLGCATTLAEAKMIEQAQLDGLILQGYEAGGHRGVFEPQQDQKLGLIELIETVKHHCHLPFIAAGGLMTGADIARVIALGASAAQLGSAFILCPESAADTDYRDRLKNMRPHQTAIVSAISGRPARGLINRMHTEIEKNLHHLPDYPIAYSAGKALHSAAKQKGCLEFAAHWAGDSAFLARELPAANLMQQLISEFQQAKPYL